MLSEKLIALGQKREWSESFVFELDEYLSGLSKDRIFTLANFSSKLNLELNTAKKLLAFLVSNDIISYCIFVPCTNAEEVYLQDTIHFKRFDSLEALNDCIDQKKNTLCICEDCGSLLDFDKSVIQFKARG